MDIELATFVLAHPGNQIIANDLSCIGKSNKTRLNKKRSFGDGEVIFRNGIDYVKDRLL